ncbi:phosphatidic acid phosphatase type 2/haloperoxidase, partial [Catenaria anguillulae PL171]
MSWIIREFLAALLTWVLALSCLLLLPPNTSRSFSISDPSIGFPLKPNTINDGPMALLSILFPIVCILVAESLLPTRRLGNVSYVSRAAPLVLGLLMATAQTEFVTDIVKAFVGEHRPDFLARCQPVLDQASGEYVCTGPKKLVADGFKSFPSGHASLMTSGILFLTLYLRRVLLSPPQPILGTGLSLMVAHLPMVAAFLMSGTRIADNRHDWWDVSAGTLLGIACTWAVFPSYARIARLNETQAPEPSSIAAACSAAPPSAQRLSYHQRQRTSDVDAWRRDSAVVVNKDDLIELRKEATASDVGEGVAVRRKKKGTGR